MAHETKNNAKLLVINCQSAVEVALGTCWAIDHGTWQSPLQLKKSLKKKKQNKTKLRCCKGDSLHNHSYVSATQ